MISYTLKRKRDQLDDMDAVVKRKEPGFNTILVKWLIESSDPSPTRYARIKWSKFATTPPPTV